MHASTASEPFVKYANEFIRLLDDDNSVIRRTAAFALGEIATVAPDDAVPAVDALIDLVDAPEIRSDATEALARIGDERPEAITAAAQPVIHYFRTLSAADDTEADDWLFQTAALEIIASIALVAPETIDDVSNALHWVMQSSQVEVRVQAADTIGVLLTERPETFGTLEPHLRTGLDVKESRVLRATILAYFWIAFNDPTAVNEPATIVERLQTIDETFDVSPEDLEQAVQAFADATREDH
jgi:HEAT repeat protein